MGRRDGGWSEGGKGRRVEGREKGGRGDRKGEEWEWREGRRKRGS